MEQLEAKKINNNIYYYYSSWAWKDGKCRRVWQKYLGKPENILRAVEAGGASPLYAEVFQWGLPLALWKESQIADIISNIDFFSPKRKQGLTTGEYLSIAAINRAMSLISHWTDSKIKVHALYCTIALLLRALMYRKVRLQGVNVSMKRFMTELDGIREVINIYKPKRGQKKQSQQTVLTKTSPLQQQLIEILKIRMEEKPF